jgi:hypothetical protein
LNSAATLSQTIPLSTYTITAGDVITLQVDVAYTTHSGGTGQVGAVALYENSAASIVAQNTDSFTTLPDQTWETFTVTYTATPADAGRQIGILLSCNSYQDVFDNVQLSVTSAPEPATMALLAVGGLVTLIRRKRK